MSQKGGSQQIPDPLEHVKDYHQQTKHNFNRYSRALGYMDWANQPNPFRRYEGAPLFTLPILTSQDEPQSPDYEALYQNQAITPERLSFNSLSRFFEYSLSITAWKEYGGNRWALRSNPSSGNLHPTEGYVLLGPLTDLPLEPGLYHYAPKEHGLELRLSCIGDHIQDVLKPFPSHSFLVGLSSIHWREAWKYGERAFRYCQHDIGHAMGTLRIAAASLGWKLILLFGMADPIVGYLLGLNRLQEFEHAEPEFPELIAAVFTTDEPMGNSLPLTVDYNAIERCVQGTWHGKANRLSRDNPIPWKIIDEVTTASWKDSTELAETPVRSLPRSSSACEEDTGIVSSPSAGQVIHQRRSALAFDGKTSMSANRFYLMLDRLLPHPHLSVMDRPFPWDALPWDPTIHLVLFVHRVDGLTPGIYMFLRVSSPELREKFQKSMHPQFVWNTPAGCPERLPLFLLEEGNAQRVATQLSCGQEIGGDGIFALGMIAEFDSTLEGHGPWFYKRLFWETGVIGQVLYLEAEAAGVRSTGIGCFFDDPVHQILGFYPSTQFQSLYHFTVGGPVEDHRLTTLPPYGDHIS